jgi:protoheme IX farnesyltransferase
MTSAAMTRSRQAGPVARQQWWQLTDRIWMAKPILSLWIAGATVATYLTLLPELDLNTAGLLISMLLLAGGGATINNVQDREVDKRYQRTRGRPLARGKVTVSSALGQGIALVVVAAAGIYLATGEVAAAWLGLVGLLLYNGVYTPIKRLSTLSILPGALAGAAPVAVGWTGAGGSLASPEVWVLMALLMVWQLPHVWLLQLSQPAADRCHMLPSLLHRLTDAQMRRLILLCVALFTGVTLLLPYSGLITSPLVVGLLLLHAVCLLAIFVWACLLRPAPQRDRILFRYWNAVVALVMVLVVLDRAVGG